MAKLCKVQFLYTRFEKAVSSSIGEITYNSDPQDIGAVSLGKDNALIKLVAEI